jgi:hypothetical protein
VRPGTDPSAVACRAACSSSDPAVAAHSGQLLPWEVVVLKNFLVVRSSSYGGRRGQEQLAEKGKGRGQE